MGSNKKAYGYYPTGNEFLPIKVDVDGKVYISGGIPEHHLTHENAGSDEISVLGLSGLLADSQTPLAHKTSHQLAGSDVISVAGLSGLLATAQTPAAHKTSHEAAGSDALHIDTIGAGTNIVTNNVSITKHGLAPIAPNDATKYLDGTGAYSVPAGAGGSGITVQDRVVTQLDVVSTNAETTFYTYNIPANTLSTNKAVRLTIIGDFLNNIDTSQRVTVKVKLGATTLYADQSTGFSKSTIRYPFIMQFIMGNQNAANVQVLGGFIHLGLQPATTGLGNLADTASQIVASVFGTAAEDTTAVRTFLVTVQLTSSSASLSMRRQWAFLELI